MSKSFILSVKYTCRVAVIALVFTIACDTPSGSLLPGNIIEPPTPGSVFDAYFTSGVRNGKALAAGAEAILSGGGSLTLPRGGTGAIDIGIAEGSLTQDAIDAFGDEFSDITLSQSVLQITARPTGAAPRYLILRLPTADATARIMIAGAVNDNTNDLTWEPLDTQFDAAAGMATALIGWEQLARVETTVEPTQKSATRMNDSAPIVYTGHVSVGVGRRFLQGEVVFVADEPTTAMTVPFGSAPVAVRARIGLKLSNITHPPLDSLTITSGFGPRQAPKKGASTFHEGVDYRAAEGTNVYAAGDGVVITSRCARQSVNCGLKANGSISGGYIVEIQHANGEVTRYMHLTEPAIVPVGVTVSAGQLIAFSGKTGGVDAHLHFEVTKNGVPVDPDLVFNQQATATLAMAVDHQIEFGTAQQIPISRGIITPADMATYVNIVELTDVEPGSHKLQFVLVQPRGQLRVLAEVPLTVLPAGDFVGNEEHVREITWTPASGLIDYAYTRWTSSFSLVATDEYTAEGMAHITFETRGTTTYPGAECSGRAYESGLVAWDTPVNGSYSRNADGTVYFQVYSIQNQSAPFTITYTATGDCPPNSPALNQEHIWVGVGANLVDGRFDLEQESELGTDESGRNTYELHVRQTKNQ